MRRISAIVLLGLVLRAASGAIQPPAGPTSIATLEEELARYRHIVSDWAGLTRYGSENSELPPPAPAERRVVFLGDQITELWGQGRAKFFPGKRYLNYYAALVEGRNFRMPLTRDGLLPNDAGYDVMAPLAEQAIAHALAEK